MNNTLLEWDRLADVQVSVGMLLAKGRQRVFHSPPGLGVDLKRAVIAEERNFDPRRERLRCLFHLSPPSDCMKFLDAVQRESARVDAVVWFGYFWDSVSHWLPRFCASPIVFHPNDSLSLAEISRQREHSIVSHLRVCWATSQERRLLQSGYRGIVYCSKADAAHALGLIAENSAPSIDGMENGVDTARFHPGPPLAAKPPQCDVCLFVGRLDYPPNVEAVMAIISVILPNLGVNVRLWLAGASPNRQIRDCCLRQPDRIHLFPDVLDMAALYRSADVFLAPMTGKGGIKNKILEAAACGIPVVTTADGVSGMGTVVPGIVVCSDIAGMASTVTALLARNSIVRQTESDAMRKFVSQRFTWAGRSERLLSFLANNSQVSTSRRTV